MTVQSHAEFYELVESNMNQGIIKIDLRAYS